MSVPRPARIAIVITLAAILVLCGIAFFKVYERRTETGEVPIGGPFSLSDQNGRRVTDADLRGQYLLIYFGYTFCPDACPTALGMMSAAMDKLGPDAEKVTPVFITVDPARDTQDVMKDYASNFHPRMVALRGNDQETEQAAKSYRIYWKKADGEDEQNYLVDHSTYILLMDPENKYLAHFGPQVTPDEIVAEIRKHL